MINERSGDIARFVAIDKRFSVLHLERVTGIHTE